MGCVIPSNRSVFSIPFFRIFEVKFDTFKMPVLILKNLSLLDVKFICERIAINSRPAAYRYPKLKTKNVHSGKNTCHVESSRMAYGSGDI